MRNMRRPPVLPPPPMGSGPIPFDRRPQGIAQPVGAMRPGKGPQAPVLPPPSLGTPGMPAAAPESTGPLYEAAKKHQLSPYNTTTQQDIMGPGMAKGGSASSRADGCAKRGKTKGKIY